MGGTAALFQTDAGDLVGHLVVLMSPHIGGDGCVLGGDGGVEFTISHLVPLSRGRSRPDDVFLFRRRRVTSLSLSIYIIAEFSYIFKLSARKIFEKLGGEPLTVHALRCHNHKELGTTFIIFSHLTYIL